MARIYFFKQAVQNDPYVALFGQHGWESDTIQVLEFNYVQKEYLLHLFSIPQAFSGLVFTSPRAVKAVKVHGLVNQPHFSQWLEKIVYVVGPATATAAQSLGFSTNGSNAGNAEHLAHLIAGHHKNEGEPLLFLCGNLRRPELPEVLTQNDIPFQECIVYETQTRTGLDLQAKDVPDAVVFFSPSGVDAVKTIWPERWSQVCCVAIGARTAKALHDTSLNLISTAIHPTPESLLNALNTFQKPNTQPDTPPAIQ